MSAERVQRYLQAVEAFDEHEVSALLAEGAVFHELPNRLKPSGETRDRAAMLEGLRRGRAVLVGQRYQVLRIVEDGDHVAVEAIWTGTLAIALGSLSPGDTMRARSAMFFELRDGKVFVQRNYDCFDPF